MSQRWIGVLGILAIIVIAILFSTNRKAIRLRVVGAAFALQAGIAFLVLYTSWGRAAIQWLSNGVDNLLGYANKGTEFLFGPSEANPLAHTFAIAALPVIIFFPTLVAILQYAVDLGIPGVLLLTVPLSTTCSAKLLWQSMRAMLLTWSDCSNSTPSWSASV